MDVSVYIAGDAAFVTFMSWIRLSDGGSLRGSVTGIMSLELFIDDVRSGFPDFRSDRIENITLVVPIDADASATDIWYSKIYDAAKSKKLHTARCAIPFTCAEYVEAWERDHSASENA